MRRCRRALICIIAAVLVSCSTAAWRRIGEGALIAAAAAGGGAAAGPPGAAAGAGAAHAGVEIARATDEAEDAESRVEGAEARIQEIALIAARNQADDVMRKVEEKDQSMFSQIQDLLWSVVAAVAAVAALLIGWNWINGRQVKQIRREQSSGRQGHG